MINAGEVGALFKVVDQVTPVIAKLVAEFNRLQLAVDRTQLALDKLKMPRGMTAALNRMAAGLQKVDAQAGLTAATVAASFGKMDASITATQASVARLAASIRGVGVSSRGLGGGGIGGIVGGGGGGGGGGGHSARGLFHAHEKVGPIGIRTHDAAMVGGIGAAYLGFEGVKAGGELIGAEERLKIAGLSKDEIAKVEAKSFQVSRDFGQNVVAVMDVINEIRNPLGGTSQALEHIEKLGSSMVVLRAIDAKTGGDTTRQLYELVRSAEFRNAIGPESFDRAIDGVVRAAVATNGRISPSEFASSEKMMKGALPGLSDSFLYTYAPELMQEFKGAASGTYLASLYQQIVAGQMRTTGLRLLDDLGEIDTSKAQLDKNGRVVRTKPGANKLADVFKNDPAEYVTRLIADMASHGITSESDQKDWISQIFGNRNAAWLADVLEWQRARLERGAAGIGQTQHTDVAAKELLANDPGTNWREFSNSAFNLGATLTKNLLPSVTRTMQDLTITINAVSAAFRGDWSSPFWAGATRGQLPLVGANKDLTQMFPSDWSKDREYLTRQAYAHQADMHPLGDMEAARAAALSRLPAPVVNVETKVSVMIDGKNIPSTQTQATRVVNGISGHDGRAGPRYSDYGYGG